MKDRVVGEEDIKEPRLVLLSKRNYSKSEVAHSKEHHESAGSARPVESIYKRSREGRAITKELKEAYEDIEGMDKEIRKNWKTIEE